MHHLSQTFLPGGRISRALLVTVIVEGARKKVSGVRCYWTVSPAILGHGCGGQARMLVLQPRARLWVVGQTFLFVHAARTSRLGDAPGCR